MLKAVILVMCRLSLVDFPKNTNCRIWRPFSSGSMTR